MISKSLTGIAIWAVAAAWAADTFQPLNLKPGLWEIELTVRTREAPPQRAQGEPKSDRNADERRQKTVKRSCLDQRELQQPLMIGIGEQRDCRRSVLVSSSARQEIRVECGKAGGTVRVETAGPQNAKVTSEWWTDDRRAVKVTSTAILKWLGADCASQAVPVAPVPPARPTGAAAPSPPSPPSPPEWDAGQYYRLGREQAGRDDLQGALESLNRAIELDSRNAAAYNARGYVYLRMLNFAAAIQDFSEAIRLRPEYLNAYFNRAVARRHAGDQAGAAMDARKAEELKDREP